MGMDWQRQGAGIDRTITVYDPHGKPLKLTANDRLTDGGEGVIYNCPLNRSILIKICKPEVMGNAPAMNRFRSRLQAMLGLAECTNSPFLAWPRMKVLDKPNGQPIGFVMNKFSGRKLRALFCADQVTKFFPGWDRLSVARVALNLVDAIRMLARYHVLVNDFNPDNFMVTPSGEIGLIDCDSYQIPAGGWVRKAFLTSLHFPDYAAPELLKDKKLLDQPRTPEQVRFSLAVLVYSLVMCGLHPYARLGSSKEQWQNLIEGKFPLDPRSGARMAPYWETVASWMPDSLVDYFVRMFGPGHSDPAVRPSVTELHSELENFIAVMERSRIADQRALKPSKKKRKR
ncbi:MAG: hypothetical protein MJ025_01610 [Victivallaceae bacterium]|nr:hypothetical protein [Victivallaceae bacterium]